MLQVAIGWEKCLTSSINHRVLSRAGVAGLVVDGDTCQFGRSRLTVKDGAIWISSFLHFLPWNLEDDE